MEIERKFLMDIFSKKITNKEEFIKNNWFKYYNLILEWIDNNHIISNSFNESLLMFIKQYTKKPKCNYYNCNNNKKFNTEKIEYEDFCSLECKKVEWKERQSNSCKIGQLNNEIKKYYPNDNVEDIKIEINKWYIDNIIETNIEQEKIYLYKYQIKEKPICKNKNCNEFVEFQTVSQGYREYCSNFCKNNCIILKNEMSNRYFEKTGYYNTAQNPEIQTKISNTTFERHGVYNISQSDYFKQKKVETCLRNRGVEYPTQCKEVISKSRATMFENSGYYTNFEKITKENSQEQWKERFDKLRLEENIEFLYRDETNLFFKYLETGEEFKINQHTFRGRYEIGKVNLIEHPLNTFISEKQLRLYEYIKEIYNGEVLLNDREVLEGLELDIYLPELKIGLEFNGIYWHSEKFLNNMYHHYKYYQCEERDIRLINIWEDEWDLYEDKIKFHLNLIIGEEINNEFNRIELINDEEALKFFEKCAMKAKVYGNNLAIKLEDKIISCISFSIKDNSINICNYVSLGIVNDLNIIIYWLKNLYEKEINLFMKNGHLWNLNLSNIDLKEVIHILPKRVKSLYEETELYYYTARMQIWKI